MILLSSCNDKKSESLHSPTRLREPTFEVELPAGFSVVRDGERINCVSREPVGVVVLTTEIVEDPDELPSLSRMLAGFLTRSGHPVATDELLAISTVPDAYGFSWQYVEDTVYHRLWIFGNEYCWLLLSFLCPRENQVFFQDRLADLVSSLRLRTHGPDA